MTGRKAERIESLVDAGAAALFAAAAAYALGVLVSRLPETVGGAALAFALGFAALRRVAPEQRHFKLSDFQLEAVAPITPGELLLTERLVPPVAKGELVLDDILAEIGPDSRVVRLFDPVAMPTAGQLKDRIDRHLEGAPPGTAPDASQALFDALAELRRSLN